MRRGPPGRPGRRVRRATRASGPPDRRARQARRAGWAAGSRRTARTAGSGVARRARRLCVHARPTERPERSTSHDVREPHRASLRRRAARPPPPPPPPSKLVINEIDYDQVGADAGGFVEIANTGSSAATLDGIALVLVNGGDGTEYARVALTGTLAAGGYLTVDIEAQNGAPDGVALIDTASERAPRRALVRGRDHRGHDRRPVVQPRRGNGAGGDGRRLEHGRRLAVAASRTRQDTNNAASDWAFTTTKTPGAANVASP